MRPEGRALRSVPALVVETSYISPKPKRCVERKVLKCLMRIIANFHPVVGGDLQEHARKPIQDLLPFRGKGMPKPLFNTARKRRNVTREVRSGYLPSRLSRRRTAVMRIWLIPAFLAI